MYGPLEETTKKMRFEKFKAKRPQMSNEQFERIIAILDTLAKISAGKLLKDTKNKTEKIEICRIWYIKQELQAK